MSTPVSITTLRVARHRRFRQWTIAAAGWTAAAVVIVGVVPTFGRLDAITAQLKQQGATAHSLAALQATLPTLSSEVDRLEHATAALHEPGTAEQQIAGLVADVRRLGRAASLGEVGWVPGDHPQRVDGLSLLPFQLHVAGDYSNTQKFMVALQALPRPIRLHDVEINADSPGSGKVDLRLTVDLVTAEQPQ